MDISKLKPEQRELAYKIGEAALKKGLNPDFVLPMVMQESGFDNSLVSKKGALGVMQIMPDTATLYKCDDPNNLDKNIDCGLNIIKDLVSKKNIGSDPYKVLAGYHSGEPEAAKFLKTGNIDDLGPNAKQHLWDVSQRYGAELPNVLVGQQPEKDSGAEAPADSAPPAQGNVVGSAPNPPLELSPTIGAGAGAFGGATVGTTAAIYQAKLDAAKKGLDLFNEKINPFTSSVEVPPVEPVPPPTEPVKTVAKSSETPGGKWGAKTGYGVGEGTVQEASSKYQRSLPKGKVSGPMAKSWGIQLPGESPELVQRMIDRAKANEVKQLGNQAKTTRDAQAAIAAENTRLSKQAEAAMLAREAQEAAQVGKSSPLAQYARKLFGLPVRGALTGAGLGFGAVDALNRYNAGDNLGASLSAGATTLGTAVPVLAPLSAATVGLYDDPEARQRFLDAMKKDGAMSKRASRRFGLD